MSKQSVKRNQIRSLILLTVSTTAMSFAMTGQAAQFWWDINDLTPGSGGPTPAGVWSTSATNWSSSTAGDVAAAVWVDGNDAIFSAGTDATGNYAVTVNGTVAANSITIEEGGTVSLSGASSPLLNLGAGGLTTAATVTSVTLNSSATITLTAPQTWVHNATGAMSFQGGLAIDNALTLTNNSAVGEMSFGTAANIGTGGVRLLGGRFVASFADNFGTGTLRMSAGSLRSANTPVNFTTTNPLVLDGVFSFLVSGGNNKHLTFTGGGTVNGAINFNDTNTGSTGDTSNVGGTKFTTTALTLTNNVVFGGTGFGTITSPIVEDATPRTITKTGTSTVFLGGANTYSGATKINGGVLQFTQQTALYNNNAGMWTASHITVGLGATLALNVGGAGEFTEADVQSLNFIGTSSAGFTSGSVLALDTTNASGGTYTHTVPIINSNGGTNALSLTKLGTGILSLTAANTYTGTTTVSAGTLSLGINNALHSSSSIAVNGGTLDISTFNDTVSGVQISSGTITGTTGILTSTSAFNAQAGTLAAILDGAVGLNKSGTGTVTLSAANTYTGTTSVSGGTLTLSGTAGSINTSSGSTISGGLLSLDNNAGNLDRIKDTGNVTLSRVGELSLIRNTGTDTTETMGTLGIDAGSSTVTVSSAASRITTLAASEFSRTNNGTALIRGSTLGGQATNVGRVTLASLAGLTQVGTSTSATGSNGGTVKTLTIVPYLIGDTAVGNTGNNFVTYDTASGLRTLGTNEYVTLTAAYTTPANHENVKSFNGSITASNPIFNSLLFNGTHALSGTGMLTVDSGAVALVTNNAASISSNFTGLTLGNVTWNEGIITVTQNTLTINTPVNVTGGGGLTKSGGATLNLTAANLYTGVTTVNAGTLTLSGNNTATTGGVHLNGGTLSLNNNGALGPSGTINFGGGAFQHTVNNLIDYSSRFSSAAGQSFIIDIGGGSGTGLEVIYATGLVSTGGSLQKIGQGTLTLTGASSYTGSTIITRGAIKLGVNDALPVGATLQMGATNNNPTFDLNGFNQTVGNLTTFISTTEIRTITNTSDTLSIFTVNNSVAGLYDGVSAIAGNLMLVKSGTGTLALGGNTANSYTGGTQINGGVLNLNSAGAIGSTGTISFGGGTLQYSTNNVTDYSSRFSTTASQAFKIDTNSLDITYSTGLASTGGSLTKIGDGALSIAGASTYTGNTTVSDGTLNVAVGGSVTNTSGLANNGNTNVLGTMTFATGGGVSGTGNLVLGVAGTQNSLTVKGIRQNRLTINGGVDDQNQTKVTLSQNGGNAGLLVLGNTATVNASPSLTIGNNAVLDLYDNDAIIYYEAATVGSTLTNAKTAFNNWYLALDPNGPQIQSQGLIDQFNNDPNHPTTLVIIDNGQLQFPEWGGETLPSIDQVLIKYTYVGDCNLDGQVDSVDYQILVGSISDTTNQPYSTDFSWFFGDMDGDGFVNSVDYQQFVINLGQGIGNPLGGGGLGGGSPIPEPSTWLLGTLAAVGMSAVGLRRRRRAK